MLLLLPKAILKSISANISFLINIFLYVQNFIILTQPLIYSLLKVFYYFLNKIG